MTTPTVEPSVKSSAPSVAPAWLHGSQRTAGSRHRADGRPCQDAAFASVELRPLAIVCDGRGSAELSHLGAEAATRAMRKAVRVLEPMLAACLDLADPAEAGRAWDSLASVLLRWLMHEQVELGSSHSCPHREFEFTVSAAVLGARHIGWLQVGDGCLVLQHGDKLSLAARPQRGEYANQTEFVSPGARTNAVALRGIVPNSGVDGIMAFSDGVALKLVNLVTDEPASGVGQILGRLASGEWTNERLGKFLEHSSWLEGGDDDRSVAYLVRPKRAPDASAGAMDSGADAAVPRAADEPAKQPEAERAPTQPVDSDASGQVTIPLEDENGQTAGTGLEPRAPTKRQAKSRRRRASRRKRKEVVKAAP